MYIRNDKLNGNLSIIIITAFGLIIIIGSLFWGINFVKKRTKPINQLIDFTQKVGEGNLNLKADIQFGNELDLLTNSFNKMLETLNYTTISKDYLYNLINSIDDLIIVSDSKGDIKLINDSTLKVLGFEKHELLGKNIRNLFQEFESESYFANTVSKIRKNINQDQEINIFTKNKKQINLLISTSILKTKNEKSKSFIIVAHDITEKNKIEKQLEIEQKGRVVAIIEAQEEERLRLASDLHDGLGQMLTGIMYFVENNIIQIGNKYAISQENVEQLQNLIKNTIKETKSIAHNIIPILLKDFGLVIAIKKLAAQINSDNDLKIKINDFNFVSRIEPRIEKILYRVCQEALNNIMKHASAKNVKIQLIKHENSIVLLIDDDGIGFDIEQVNLKNNFSGIGLITMKERVSALNGVFSLSSEKNKGTEILIEIPC